MDIEAVKNHVQQFGVVLTRHALRQMVDRDITRREVEQAILSGEIIEEYPERRHSPCCLVYGQTETGRPLHVVCSLPPQLRVITTYEPDAVEWVDYRVRRG